MLSKLEAWSRDYGFVGISRITGSRVTAGEETEPETRYPAITTAASSRAVREKERVGRGAWWKGEAAGLAVVVVKLVGTTAAATKIAVSLMPRPIPHRAPRQYLFIKTGPITRTKLPREPSSYNDGQSGVDDVISMPARRHADVLEHLSTRSCQCSCQCPCQCDLPASLWCIAVAPSFSG